MSDSESSDLSEAPSEPIEEVPIEDVPPPKTKTLKLKQGKLNFGAARDAPRQPSPPPPPPREPTPPHDYVLADNPDVAFLVLFRHRFSDVFPKNVPSLGPQDIEQGVSETPPSERVENYLCALLGLCLNRVKDVERGHHSRALEEAISANKTQWPVAWNGSNPLPGQRSFTDMSPEERLTLLRAIVLWSLNSSNVIKEQIALAYKQTRREDDMNQPLTINSWGEDGRKQKYWLFEGQEDTCFRVYMQRHMREDNESWWSIAGSLDELRLLVDNLRIQGLEEHTPKLKRMTETLADRMEAAIPRLEVCEEKRKRKEYRLNRKTAFTRPDPGFSLYEGRTRGKRMKYTFSDEEDEGSDAVGRSRSGRHSDRSTPVDASAPTMTSSGRQVRSRFGRSYGDPLSVHESGQEGDSSISGRRTRGQPNGSSRLGRGGSSSGETSDEADDVPSGEEWEGNDEDFDGRQDKDEDDDMSEGGDSDDSIMNLPPRSLVVTLRYRKGRLPTQIYMNGAPRPDGYPATNGSTIQYSPGRGPSSAGKNSSTPQRQMKADGHGLSRPQPSSGADRPPPAFKPDPYGPWNPYQQQTAPHTGHYYGGTQNNSWQNDQQDPLTRYQGYPTHPASPPPPHPHLQYQGQPPLQQPTGIPHQPHLQYQGHPPQQQPRGSPHQQHLQYQGHPPQQQPKGSPLQQQSPHNSPRPQSSYGQPHSQPQWPGSPPAYPPYGPPQQAWQQQQYAAGPPRPFPGAMQLPPHSPTTHRPPPA